MEFEEKRPCKDIKVDGFMEKGTQFDLEINLPEDNRDVIFGIIRINLFSEYILKCANIINDYIYSNKKAQIKSIINDINIESDSNSKKSLLEMQK